VVSLWLFEEVSDQICIFAVSHKMFSPAHYLSLALSHALQLLCSVRLLPLFLVFDSLLMLSSALRVNKSVDKLSVSVC
jgi:hypothetical protein